MLDKNIKKLENKNRPLWTPYYERVVKDKKKEQSKKQCRQKVYY